MTIHEKILLENILAPADLDIPERLSHLQLTDIIARARGAVRQLSGEAAPPAPREFWLIGGTVFHNEAEALRHGHAWYGPNAIPIHVKEVL